MDVGFHWRQDGLCPSSARTLEPERTVEGIYDSLRRELLPYGIDVILIEPGAVRTEIWDKGASQAGRAGRN